MGDPSIRVNDADHFRCLDGGVKKSPHGTCKVAHSLSNNDDLILLISRSPKTHEKFQREIAVLKAVQGKKGLAQLHSDVSYRDKNGCCVPAALLERYQDETLKTDSVAREAIDKLQSQLLGALDRFHETSYIHRDIKPANIFIDKQENPILGDFDIACKKTDKLWSIERTPGYMAPESACVELEIQALAESWPKKGQQPSSEQQAKLNCLQNEIQKVTTTAVDIFAMGKVFYEMGEHDLPSGLFPQTATSKEQVELKAQFTLPLTQSSESERTKLIRQMLDPNPQKRPSAKEALEQLQGPSTQKALRGVTGTRAPLGGIQPNQIKTNVKPERFTPSLPPAQPHEDEKTQLVHQMPKPDQPQKSPEPSQTNENTNTTRAPLAERQPNQATKVEASPPKSSFFDKVRYFFLGRSTAAKG